MIRFFDYVYYRICKFYAKYEKAAETSGLIILGLLHFFNIYTIYILFCIFMHNKLREGPLTIIILIGILLLLNGIRYNKVSYDILQEKWKKEDKQTQLKRGTMVVTYIILSTVICIALVIYLGSKNW